MFMRTLNNQASIQSKELKLKFVGRAKSLTLENYLVPFLDWEPDLKSDSNPMTFAMWPELHDFATESKNFKQLRVFLFLVSTKYC